MGGTASRLQNCIDGMAQDIGATLVTVTNMIGELRYDVSGTMINIANQCLASLRMITHRANQTSFLLTNAVLALSAAIALGILLYLTYFSPFLRAIVWIMYACLCLHMVLTYVRHSSYPPLPNFQLQEGKGTYFFVYPIRFKIKDNMIDI